MTKIFLKIFAALFLLFANPAEAQEVTLDDFAWLAGQWVEERDDGTTIEINWAPPIGKVMVGTLQLLEGENLLAYENFRIIETATGFEYFIDKYARHNNFANPRTDQIQLVTVEHGRAVFEGLVAGDAVEVVFTIEITEADELLGWTVMKGSGTDTPSVNFKATRVDD